MAWPLQEAELLHQAAGPRPESQHVTLIRPSAPT